MTADRYVQYQRALELMAVMERRVQDSDSVRPMRQLAEDMLLDREHSMAETSERAREAAAILSRLADRGELSRSTARRLWRMLVATGPDQPRDATEWDQAEPGPHQGLTGAAEAA
jgi:hypothetical protein